MRGADEIKLLPAYVLFYDSQSAPPPRARDGRRATLLHRKRTTLSAYSNAKIHSAGAALACTRFSGADVRSRSGSEPGARCTAPGQFPGLLVKRMRALAERAMILQVWQ